jgi:diguanylate cyclase (GGDEF)-like protein
MKMGREQAETNPMEARRRSLWLLWALAAVMAAGALGVLAVLPIGPAHTGHPLALPWWVLAIAFAVSELCALNLQFRGESYTFTLSEIMLVLGLFFVSPVGLLAAHVVGVVIAFAVVKRLPLLKVVFNVAQFAFGTAIAVWVFRTALAASGPADARGWLAALGACAASAIVGFIAIGFAVTVAEGTCPARALTRSFAFGIAGTVVNTMLGLLAVIMSTEHPMAALLLLGPVAVVFVAYRAYLSERSKSEGLQFLYSASEILSGARDLEAGLLALLDFARDTFHAEIAEVVLRGEHDEAVGYHTCAGPGDRRARLEPIAKDDVQVALDAAGDSEGALLLRPTAGTGLALRHGVEVASLMVATMRDEHGVRGGVLVARPRGSAVEVFARDELRLFETFANHLGTTMEKSRLSTSLAQLRVLKQELAHQAFHDTLTGLANRALFRERVEEALTEAASKTSKVAVLFIDLDDFKTVNDTMGHAAGDALLEEVARRIAGAAKAGDTAARLGGDEFAVLVRDIANDTEARAVADRILVALGDPIEINGQRVVTQASIGIASHAGAANAAELMQHADVAMYTAKRNGKGRFDEFEPTMSLTVARRHQLKLGLERAIANDEFVLHYQPVIEVATGEITATEALLRWKDPTRGLMPPSEFVGVAEETGLIVPIGRFVLREACRQAAEWAPTTPGLRIFVNLSTRQLADPDIVNDVCDALEDAGLNPNHLTLEVTETAMMRDIDEARETLYALKALGVDIAIDDFGTGFSSLSYLRQLPIDVLKIAKPIIDAICESSEDSAFVKGIIELGHVVGLQVVAEGVEQVEQYAHLVAMGCDFVQGYYYAPSMEPSEMAEILRTPAVPEVAAPSRDLERIAL